MSTIEEFKAEIAQNQTNIQNFEAELSTLRTSSNENEKEFLRNRILQSEKFVFTLKEQIAKMALLEKEGQNLNLKGRVAH